MHLLKFIQFRLGAISFAFLFLSFPDDISAVAPSLLTYPTSVDTDIAFSVTATMSGLSGNALYRLRLAFAPPSTSNYFGSTFNGTVWYNGTPAPIDYSNFLTINTNAFGSWNGTIQGKAELSDPNFDGTSGTYDFKLGRYTQSGTTATWSNIVQIPITAPTPTPIPTFTPTPSPTVIPTNTPTPTPTKIPTLTPDPKILDAASISADPLFESSASADIMGTESGEFDSSSSAINSPKPVHSQDNAWKFIMGGGVILLSSSGIMIFRRFKEKYE